MVFLYNTMSRSKEELKPITPGTVKIYSCGPTVYNFVHIGNLRAFVCADILRRWLKYRGFKVTQVMNLTDVDDKTIKGSRKEGLTLKAFTEKYAKAFFDDIRRLNIEPVEVYPKATEHIPQMVAIVEKLLKKGTAYKSEDGSIYYSIAKFPDYGKLAHLDLGGLKAGARVKQDSYEKQNVSDFALWKAWDPEDGDVFWETPIGKGRPGWHIECSAMSMKYLGETFDIHTGGIDLVFPHHQNEIAQSEGATGKTFVKYWVHNEHLMVEGQKMSKSLGNFYTLRDLLDKGLSPKSIRWVLMSTHYRRSLDFNFKDVEAANNTLSNLQDFLTKLKDADGKGANLQPLLDKTQQGFESCMDDDLNISEALAAMFDFVHEVNKLLAEGKVCKADGQKAFDLLMKFDTVLGVLAQEKMEISKDIEAKIKAREEARKKKDWKLSDKIRDELRMQGIILEDTEKGVRWKKVV
jgi:cysteinyl-tRNA synthetase